MNLTKKLLSSALVCAMMAPMFTMNIFAAAVTPPEKDTTVSYDNTSEIADPESPANPQWAVTIPSTIAFKDGAEKVSADLTVILKNGAANFPAKKVTISAKSVNEYYLKLTENATDYKLKYAIEYTTGSGANDKVLLDSGKTFKTIKEFGNLSTANANELTIKGEAVMQGTATKTGAYKDTVTYQVEVATVI